MIRQQNNYLAAMYGYGLYSYHKIIRIVCALSLVSSCVWMRVYVWKHVCDITRILIGYVLSDARFDWLVGKVRRKEKQHFPSFVKLYLRNII